MKTDTLFYELFKFDPRSLFQLMRLKIKGKYSFESITVKTSEKRFDGFFKRTDGEGPNIFLEVQGYNDNEIFWRIFREVCTWYEQNPSTTPFVIIVLFLDEKYDPDNCQLSCKRPNRMIKGNLSDYLEKVKGKAGALTVLKPLTLSNKEDLSENVHQWNSELDAMNLSKRDMKLLTEMLEYAILQRFPKLTIKEIQTMLELTPLDKTVAGQELIQMGIAKGMDKGMAKGMDKGMAKGLDKGMAKGLDKGFKKGELVGEIRLMQNILKYPVTPRSKLIESGIRTLKMTLKQLRAEFKAQNA
ncbi:DUF2887 domain-containing protein [Desulfobacterales bacterium HSG16]|nr:DUF2887 domain-containing protein [Desulfobacterales bacterium HSG16]